MAYSAPLSPFQSITTFPDKNSYVLFSKFSGNKVNKVIYLYNKVTIMLLLLIMLYWNMYRYPSAYVHKHIYELRMIKFSLFSNRTPSSLYVFCFYKLLAKKNSSKLTNIDIKRCFWSRWRLSRYFCLGIFKMVWYLYLLYSVF